MKKFLLGSAGLAAMLAGPAMAADMPVAPPPPPVVYYDWSGAYIGFNAGGIWHEVDRTFPIGAVNGRNTTTNDSDGIYGFHAGAQWQWGAWVLGAETALSGCFKECISQTTSPDLVPPFATPDRFQQNKITNLFTVGGRLGYAWDRFLLFGSGGYASADLKGAFCQFSTGQCLTGNSGAARSTGWYAGGGFDYMVHKGPLVDVILGLEYQHFDLDSHEAFRSPLLPVQGYDLGAKGDLVRARLTIKTQGYGFYYR
jgi:outer membrane immunogenic protein